MYSGQGSHYYHMGRDLFEQNSIFRAHLKRLDNIAFSQIGCSTIDILFDPSKQATDLFNKSALTNTGIFIMERALSLMLNEQGIEPDYVLGSSMGTFAAACQAGCLNEDAALAALLSQSKAIEQHAHRGIMIAVMDNPEHFTRHPFLVHHSEIASINFNSHYVIALPSEFQSQVVKYLQDHGIIYQEIAVEYPYHSRWIEPAESVYRQEMAHFNFDTPKIPLICCAKAGQLMSVETNALWRIARQPIEFQKTINFLENINRFHYVDLGPSGTLATFLKYLLPKGANSKYYPTITPYKKSQQNIDALLAELSTAE